MQTSSCWWWSKPSWCNQGSCVCGGEGGEGRGRERREKGSRTPAVEARSQRHRSGSCRIVVSIKSLVVHRRGFQVAHDRGHGLGSAGYDFRMPNVGRRDLPSRTSANLSELNSSELHQNLCETLESRRTLTKLGECRLGVNEGI